MIPWEIEDALEEYQAAISQPVPPASQQLLKLVAAQAEDEVLWCNARTIVESVLQAALRELHAAIEAAHGIKATPQGKI